MERSLALEALGRTYFHDYQGDLAWQCLKEALDLRMESGEEGRPTVAELCASALEIPTRWRGVMRSRPTREEVMPYFEIGVAHAEPESEAACRIMIVRSFFPMTFQSSDEHELIQARLAGERAAELAARLSRPDLGSAALDGLSAYYMTRGEYGPLEEVVERRLKLLGSLDDPQEIADVYSMGARVAMHRARFRDVLTYANGGYEAAMRAAPVWALDCLDWRALAHFWLGEWDEFLADAALSEEVLGERRETPPGFASDHLAARAFLHEVRGEEGEAEHILQLLAWLQKVEERPGSVRASWTARLYARRKLFDLAAAELDRPGIETLIPELDSVLQARCELAAEGADWDAAASLATSARKHAEASGTPALALFADRLEGRAALAGGDAPQAVDLLSRASSGFRGLEAAWEAAVTETDLADALVRAGRVEEARNELETATPVLERLNSVRELRRARALLDQIT
jgi:tetratricopeptide (TPR) repeat protein